MADPTSDPESSALACEVTGQHQGDIYSVALHPNEKHMVTGGFDHTLRLVDMRTGVAVHRFSGHAAPVTHAIFNP